MTQTPRVAGVRRLALAAAAAASLTIVACGGGSSSPVLSAVGGNGGTGGSATEGTGGDSATGSASTHASAVPAPTLADCELFPNEAVFNTPIDDPSRFPAHASSSAWIASIGASTPFRADWIRGDDPTIRTSYYGMPVNVIDPGSTRWAPLSFDHASLGIGSEVGWGHESDCAVADGGGWSITRGCASTPGRSFPLPQGNLLAESGTCSDPAVCGDHHVLVVERGACRLWEAFAGYSFGGPMAALSTAAWDLRSLSMRPNGWTSADAAGLPITPFLVKEREASAGEIRHALRVTFRDAVLSRGYTWPARHGAGHDDAGSIPFGSVLRLKADFAIPADWTPQARAIATAAKRYGMYVADIGMDFYVQGEPSANWDDNTFRQVATIPLSQMEFVDLGAITRDPRFSPDSMAARW